MGKFYNCRLRDGKYYAVLLDERGKEFEVEWTVYIKDKQYELGL